MTRSLGPASDVTRRSGHDLSSADIQVRERALVQCAALFEALILLVFADRRTRHRSHFSISSSRFVAVVVQALLSSADYFRRQLDLLGSRLYFITIAVLFIHHSPRRCLIGVSLRIHRRA